MAVVLMGTGEDQDPIFHDFLGMSSGDGNGGVSPAPNKGGVGGLEAEASAGHSSEGMGANNSEVFHFHGRKNDVSEPGSSNTLSGRKRSISSSYVSLIRDRMLSIGSDSQENLHMMKTLGKGIVTEQNNRDDEPCSMQPPPQPTSVLLHPPVTARPESLVSKWERSIPMNPGAIGRCSSRFGQQGAHKERHPSAYSYKDIYPGAALIPQPAADEGSRTGVKGSKMLDIINSTSEVGERNTAAGPSYSDRRKAPQIVAPEYSNLLSRYNLGSSSRQMTIFYAGQAHVFDDVHPNKADIIMALAGSSGVSWTTNCLSPKLGTSAQRAEAQAPSRENQPQANSLQVSIPRIHDHGLITQVAQAQQTIARQNLTLALGDDQVARRFGDPNLNSAAGPDTDGKRHA